MARMIGTQPFHAVTFAGKRYDCGSKLGYLEATVEFGLKHENLGDQFANYLARLVADRLRRDSCLPGTRGQLLVESIGRAPNGKVDYKRLKSEAVSRVGAP